jgi:hypothetical protein
MGLQLLGREDAVRDPRQDPSRRCELTSLEGSGVTFMPALRRRGPMWKLATAFAMALSLLGCADVTAPDGHVGEYALESFNGELPYFAGEFDFWGDIYDVEVVEGRIELRANGQFWDRLTIRLTGPDGVFHDPLIVEGTYSVRGQEITFNSPGEVLVANLSNGRLVIEGQGNVAVYRVQ